MAGMLDQIRRERDINGNGALYFLLTSGQHDFTLNPKAHLVAVHQRYSLLLPNMAAYKYNTTCFTVSLRTCGVWWRMKRGMAAAKRESLQIFSFSCLSKCQIRFKQIKQPKPRESLCYVAHVSGGCLLFTPSYPVWVGAVRMHRVLTLLWISFRLL